MNRFLQRRISAAVWELLLILLAAVIFATVYRVYFSRAVTLTQVCQKVGALQSGDSADLFKGDTSSAFNDINELCQFRRPKRD